MKNDTFLVEADEDFSGFSLKGKKRRDCEADNIKAGLTKTQAVAKCKRELGGGSIVRGAKKVSLAVPRGATLSLINLNYRGFASRLNRAKTNEPSKYREVINKWISLGGNEESLEKSMNKGKDKKPFFCGKKCKEKFELGFDGVNELSDDEKALFNKLPDEEYLNELGTATVGALIATGGSVLTGLGAVIGKTVANKQEQEAYEEGLKTEKEFKEKQEEEKSKRMKFIVIGGAIGLTIIGLSTYLILKKKK